MPEHDLEKLLGGFAADTLTPTEREILFRAALQDQELFNALADEQALKELLADPAVRRRLLQTLAPVRAINGWRRWLDRLASPAGLAWAGGVAVGVFAVVLGLRVYEEGLRRASETAVPEEARLQAPSTTPQTAPPAPPSFKDADHKESKAAREPEPVATDTLSKRRDHAAASRPQDTPAPGIERDQQRKAFQQENFSDKPSLPPLGMSTEQPASSTDQLAAPTTPSASKPDSHVSARTDREAATAGSARALFYAYAASPKTKAEQEIEAVVKRDRLALAKKAPQKAAPAIPLALRYSVLSEQREPDVNVAEDYLRTAALVVESNQEAYVQIWKRAGDALPELVLPAKVTGRISLKTAAGERQRLTVPGESDQLIVRLSRVPFGPITRQEAVMAGRGSPTQLRESISNNEEQATYVANPDVSTAELAIEIPIGPSAR